MRNLLSKRAVLPLIAAIALLAVFFGGQTPVSAHEDCNWDGKDFACVSANHEGANICDKERDGNLVSGLFILDTGEYVQASDGDGANDSCQVLLFGPNKHIEEFCVWEEGHDCDMEYP